MESLSNSPEVTQSLSHSAVSDSSMALHFKLLDEVKGSFKENKTRKSMELFGVGHTALYDTLV